MGRRARIREERRAGTGPTSATCGGMFLAAALAVVGCVRDDRIVPSESVAEREIGSFTVGRALVRVHATKRTVHRDPCEQSFIGHRDCNDATIVTHVDAELDGRRLEVAAYDSGADGSDRIVVADRDTRSFARVDREARETLEALRVVSCQDDSHAAFRVETPHNPGWFELVSFRYGALVGVSVPDPEEQRCEVVLRAARAADERLEREHREGTRQSFDFDTRRGSIARAFEFSLRHPIAVDAFRESTPLVDDAFLERLASEASADPAFTGRVVDRLGAPDASFEPGPRGSRDLTAWLRAIVGRLPVDARRSLGERLAAACGAEARCADPQRGMWLEAVRGDPSEVRCPVAAAAARAVVREAGASLEARLIDVAHSFADCEGSAGFAATILAAASSFPARDEDFVFPPCLDLIATGVVPGRCASLPSLAVVLARGDCRELVRAAAPAASSGRRPFEVGALAVYRRCGLADDERTLAARLRASGRYDEHAVRAGLDHGFPP